MSEKIATKIKLGLTGEEYRLQSIKLYETCSVILSAPTAIDWTTYTVNVTDTTSGIIQFVTLSSNGIGSFQIEYGHVYTIQLPIVAIYLQPQSFTFTASQPLRELVYTYTIGGVFGIDYVGKKYTINECNELTDKTIIIAGGYTDTALEASTRDDGTTGNGFMWNIDNTETILSSKQWASSNIEFNTTLLPFVTNDTNALKLCNGEAYTRYMISEAARLNLSTSSASGAYAKTFSLAGHTKIGYLPAYGQLRRLALNYSSLQALYTALGRTAPTITSGRWWTSCQNSATNGVNLDRGGFSTNNKNLSNSVFVAFDL